MCGLFGFYSPDKTIQNALMESGLNHLYHRGPDQRGFWISPSGSIALGQTRLSINDLSHIDLPFTNRNKTIRVVANGEIYNYAVLKRELQSKGHLFQTNCDVEVLPFLYEEYGINFINKLRGEFSFILWDEKQQALFAVRDRFGIKPLYYAVNGNTLYFSSEIPALLELKVTSNKWNTEAFFDFTHLSLPYRKSLFSGIHQVPPAHYLVIQHEHRHLHAYWDIHYQPNHQWSEEDIIESIKDKLIESVSLRTKADVPVGCYLSGGIDSSTLLGISSRLSHEPMNAFTIAFEDTQVDESSISERTAVHANARLHKVLVTEQNTVDYFDDVVKKTCFLAPNTAGVARFLLSQFTKQLGYKVVLSGEGADEVFLGYWGAMIEATEDPSINASFQLSEQEKQTLLRQLPITRNESLLPASLQQVNSTFRHLPSWLTTQAFFNYKHRLVLSSDIHHQFRHYSPYMNLVNSLNIQDKFKDFDHVQISSYTWIKSFFPNTMLNWIGDRAEMLNSIEARQPYLDHELFELMAKVPTTMKIKGGIEKYLLREVAKPYVTDEIYKRKKFMFQAPPLRLNKASKLYQHIVEIIMGHLQQSAIYDKVKVMQLLDTSRNPDKLSLNDRVELSYTLTSIASALILSSHYHLT